MGEVLKYVTLNGGSQKKTQEIFVFIAKMTQFEDLFYFSFGLNDLF